MGRKKKRARRSRRIEKPKAKRVWPWKAMFEVAIRLPWREIGEYLAELFDFLG